MKTESGKGHRKAAIVTAIAACALAAAFVAASCEVDLGKVVDGPLTFQVVAAGGDWGSEAHPLEFASDEMTLTVSVRALDQNGEPTRVDGDVHINVAPTGKLIKGQRPWITLKNGVAKNVPIGLKNIHGKSFIWIEDTGPDDEHPGSYATGLSDPIWVRYPTIRNMQETDNILSSPLKGDFVEIEIGERTLIVTGVTADGFYVTDVGEQDDVFNAVFVFSFSRPRDTRVGDRLSQLSGIADEYYGFTELSFPSWIVAERGFDPPPPVTLTAEMVADGDAMETYESRLVEAFDAVVCPITEDFETYGQWAVALPGGSCSGDGAVNVISQGAAPGFDPTEHVGDAIAVLRGNLRFHQSASPQWMIYPRDEDDLDIGN